MKIYKIFRFFLIIFVVLVLIFISGNDNKNKELEPGFILLDPIIINPNYIQGSSIDSQERGINVNSFQGTNSDLQRTSNLFINSSNLIFK
ncbi:MAG: hypothetical protein PHH83_02690 [Patescibacteria group bacterium]|nr:hypothetical protein [Patescibacteria group bacterium]